MAPVKETLLDYLRCCKAMKANICKDDNCQLGVPVALCSVQVGSLTRIWPLTRRAGGQGGGPGGWPPHGPCSVLQVEDMFWEVVALRARPPQGQQVLLHGDLGLNRGLYRSHKLCYN